MPQTPQIEVSLKSILKASTESSPSNSPTRNSPSRRSSSAGVHFKPPDDFEETLQAVANQSVGREKLDDFITHMKNQKGQALVEWLQRIQENLNHLKPSLETFVLAILAQISWADQEKPVISAFKHFLINLISAQSYYTKPVVKMLLYSLQGPKEVPEDPKAYREAFEGAHEALRAAVRISPLAAHMAISAYCRSCMPFMATYNTHLHTNYISNLAKISQYLPDERAGLLNCIMERLVQLDAELPIGKVKLFSNWCSFYTLGGVSIWHLCAYKCSPLRQLLVLFRIFIARKISWKLLKRCYDFLKNFTGKRRVRQILYSFKFCLASFSRDFLRSIRFRTSKNSNF